MDLTTAMAENPGLKAEVDIKVKEGFDKGVKTGTESVEARIKGASPYLEGKKDDKGNTTAYPVQIQNLAIQVLKGEASPDSLKGAVTAFDAMAESLKSNAASQENGEETPAGGKETVNPDGTVNNEAEYQAAIDRAKANSGQPAE
jgi:hypothetical protein